ncbi:hypothetical protein [Geobacter sp.]|uniref:hypothetical protein n=1 Tax=Geobacter sp. TaxID=46610 RepID=UPI00260D40BB|nr:hypothetical protein [Geobacter sp.]
MCGSKHHDKHLCSLKSRGELLTSGAVRVECGHCGVRADHPGKVCDPVSLPTIGWFSDGSDLLD